jgi:hypothetical protein
VNFTDNTVRVGSALDSAGNELYVAYDNGATADGISRSIEAAESTQDAFLVNVSTGLADIATGTDFYAANADGTIESSDLTAGPIITLGTLGSGVVGLEVISKPNDSKK